jgi:hypothetical protein
MARFYARHESALRSLATEPAVRGRLGGEAPVVIGDHDPAGDQVEVLAPFELYGPGDVRGLAPGAITRRFPMPGASDAERTKLALVEFTAYDLPWRYTPHARAEAEPLRPWIVLVVATRGPQGIVERPDGRVALSVGVQREHPLAASHRWAHVHEPEGGHSKVARILCPKKLGGGEDEGSEYLACVVPSFTDEGGDAWSGQAPETVPCYDRWSFRTGPAGDFPQLAGRLRKADTAAIEAAGTPFGRVDLRYRFRRPGPDRRPAPGPTAGPAPDAVPDPAPDPNTETTDPTSVVLSAAGALRLPHRPADGPDPAGTPPDDDVADEVAALTRRLDGPEGRRVIGPPRYDTAFRLDAPAAAGGEEDDVAATGWAGQLRRDPRARGAAGLGAWAAIAWQERISEAAARRAGDLAVAQDRLRDVALGIEVNRSLWRRHLPADPVARLAVLAPMLGRLPATGYPPGRPPTVLSVIAGRSTGLTGTLLSSAARRALRPGPARTALAEPGAADPRAVLSAANRCPEELEDPAEVPQLHEVDEGQIEMAVHAAVHDAAGDRDDLAELVLDRLARDHPGSEAALAAALAALAPGPDGEPDHERLERFLDGREEYETRDLPAALWSDWVRDVAIEAPCRPFAHLDQLGEVVAAAVDPNGDRPPAMRRVLATLPGVTRIGPLELEPELDLPLWSFVSEHAPAWMLPGADGLGEHEVVGLATNPAFVTAFLAGANHQAVAELRWRNLPLTSRWSPLRRFWQRPDGTRDIVPIRGWPQDAALGAPPLLATGPAGEAVIAFRTPLFHRYPATVVYLYPADAAWTAPDEKKELVAESCKEPTFTGTIGDDLTFFGFDVAPDALANHWVVLEEPPSGHRFYHEDHLPTTGPSAALPPAGLDDQTAHGFACRRFALPVRVLIGPLL